MAPMRCGDCGTENRDAAKFCGECGGRLERMCTSCAAPLPDGLKFCDQCGTPVAGSAEEPAPETPVAARKLVTVAFVDLGGSTAFGEVVDAETARTVMGRYHSLVTETVETHGGTVAKYIGDGVMVFFGVPEVAEDDAVRAVAFAADVQERFTPFAQRVLDRHGATVTLRVGINTGEIVIGEDDVDLYGDALNVAARLEKACPHGGVLVGEETWRLARGAFAFEAQGEIEVHGRVGGVRPFLLALDEVVEDQTTPFVGRTEELDRLGRLFAATVADRRPALASVVGPPGVGKTRLSRELQTLVEKEDALVYVTACDREGDATLGPIADLLRPDEIADVDAVRAGLAGRLAGEADADRIVEGLLAVLGLATKKVSVEETFWALRRLIERLGRDAPVVLIVDDIQWASEQLLDLFEHLVTWVDDTPLLLVLLARPELRDLRPDLAQAGRTVDELVLLSGLDPASTAALAARLLGTDDLPRGLAERLPASTDGNPLFVRELVRMLVDERVIRIEGDRWVLTVEPDAIDVPPTIQSLLAARVERLPPDERAVLERAAVIGPDFTRDGLAQLCQGAERSALPQLLRSLARKELIEATGSYWGDDPIHRFHHVLIRDAVYRRLLKEARAGLHERIGAWMVEASADVLGEHDAAIGHHLEQAFHYRRELGDDDAECVAIGARAADRLGAAARVALRDDDLVAAGALARRALGCLADEAPTRPDTLILACEALLEVGDASAARPLVDELIGLAERVPALAGWADAYDAQAITIAEPDRLAEAESIAARAVEATADIDDPAGRAKAHLVRAAILARRGRIGECEAELDIALTEARQARDTRRVVSVLGVAPLAALWGPSPVARAGGRCLDVLRLLRITASSPAVEAVALRCQAVLEALRGRFDTAYSLVERARVGIEELGLRRELAEIAVALGEIHLLAGRPGEAETALRHAHEELVALRAGAEASQAAALLGRALLRLGRVVEVEELVDEAERLAGENLKATILGATVRAEWLLAAGRPDEARTAAERAVTVAERTDLILDHADACAALDVARNAPQTTALALRERKGVALTSSPVHGPEADGRIEGTGRSDRPVGRTDVERRIEAVLADLARAWERGDRQSFWAHFTEDTAIDVRRPLSPQSDPGEVTIERHWALQASLPHVEWRIDAISERGVVTMHNRFRDGSGNEIAMLLVFELSAEYLVERLTSFEGDDVAGATAVFDERVRERGGRPSDPAGSAAVEPARPDGAEATPSTSLIDPSERPADDPLDRVEFVVPELRRMVEGTPYGDLAGIVEAYATGDDERLAWFYGRDDVVVENHQSTVNSGTTLGGDAIELITVFRRFFPRVERCEILAIRGSRHGVSRCTMGDDDGNLVCFIAVDEVDREGRIVRNARFDDDAIMQAVAALDEWYLASEDAVGREIGSVGRGILATNHVPARRDELLHLLPDDLVIRFDDALASWGEVGRDEYLTIADTLTAEANRIDYWAVWFEPLGEQVATSVVRRIAVMPDGTAPEWMFATAFRVRDGQARVGEMFRVEDLDRARARARELNGLGAFGTLPSAIAGVPLLDPPAWNKAVRSRLRVLELLNDRGRASSTELIREDGVLEDRRPLVGTESRGGAEVVANRRAMMELVHAQVDTGAVARNPFRLVGVLGTVGDHFSLTAESIDGLTDLLLVSEIDEDGRFRRTASFEADQLDEARALLAEWSGIPPTSPLADDPLDRIEFVVPGLRRMVEGTPYGVLAGILDAYALGDGTRLAWFYGRDDVVVENRMSTVNSGISVGPEAIALATATRQTFPDLVRVELLAVRGGRFGAVRCEVGDDEGSRYAFIAVDEADREGRVVRSTRFDPDAVTEAVALLDEWYLASADRLGREVDTVHAAVVAANHDVSRRDELLQLLPDDIDIRFAGELVSWGQVSRDEYLAIVDTLAAAATRIDYWVVWSEPLGEHVATALVRRTATMPDGTNPEWLFAIVVEARDGQAQSAHLFPVEELAKARARARELNGLGAFGSIPEALDGMAMIDPPEWNEAVRWRLRMLAFFNDLDRDPSVQLYRDDAEVVDRRPLLRSEFVGRDQMRAYGASLLHGLDEQILSGAVPPSPFRLTGVLAVEGQRCCLTAEFCSNIADYLHLIEVDGDGLLVRIETYEPEQLDEALAALAEWSEEAGPAVADEDPLDRCQVPAPDLRRFVGATPYGELLRNRVRAWEDDDTVRWLGAEILAVRGHRHGVVRVTFTDEAGDESAGLVVDEADRDGGIVRSAQLDGDAVIEAIELVEAWFAASPDAMAVEMALAGSSLLHSVHDPSRRDQMLARLDPDLVMPNVSGATLLGDLGRDEFVALQDTVTEAAERADFWWVWGETRSETLTCSIVRRDAVMPDGSTAEWLNATVSQWRDGRMVLSENYAIEDLDRARARTAELNGLGAFGARPEALADASFVDFADWNDAARSRHRHAAAVNAGRVHDPALAAAVGDLPDDPYRLIEVLAVEGDHRCLTHEAVLGAVDRLVLCEVDDAGRTLVARHYDPERLDEALGDLRSPRLVPQDAMPVRPNPVLSTDPAVTPDVSPGWRGPTVAARTQLELFQEMRDLRAAGVRDARVVGPMSSRFAPGIVRTDNRSVGSGTWDADEMDRSTQVLADLGFVLAASVGLARRGQHHALGMASLQSDENELLTVVGFSFRADGLQTHYDVNDPATALGGYRRMLDRYLADGDDDADPGWVALDRAVVDALAADDRQALRSAFSDDLRATLVDGTKLDADGYVDAHLDFRASVPGALTWIADMLVVDDRAMAEILTADLEAGMGGHQWFQYVIWERRDGRIVAAEHHGDAASALDSLHGVEVPVTFADPSLADVVRGLPWWPSVLRIREEWRNAPESLIEWLYGREDVRSESMIPVVGSGVKQGAEVVELSKGLQAFFPRVVVNEVAAVLGTDLLRALIVLADADGANHFAAQFVIQFADDGRIIRQATFESDDEAQAQATLEAWRRERPPIDARL